MEHAINQKSGSIFGTWKLVSLEIQRENREVTYPFGKNAQGSLIYTKSGRFSAQVMRPDRPRVASDDQLKGTLDEVKANYEGFVSYYGTYQFDRKKGLVWFTSLMKGNTLRMSIKKSTDHSFIFLLFGAG